MSDSRRALSSALQGCTIVVAADRRSSELAAALQRHGAAVRHAPALSIVPRIHDDVLLAATRELIARPPDIVVATSGVGFRGWMEAAGEAGLVDELHEVLGRAHLVARGPKARGSIQQAGFTADWVAVSATSVELSQHLIAAGVVGRRIAVQNDEFGADGLDDLLADAGADVVSLTVYHGGPPPDPVAVSRSVVAAARGEVDAVLFTSAPGAAEWVAAAEREDALDDIVARSLRGRLLLGAAGPVTAGPLLATGADTLIAERGSLGSLVHAVVTHYSGGSAASLPTTAGTLELRSAGVVLDGRHIPLSPSATGIMAALFEASGAVVPRHRLHAALPRSGDSTHAVEMAIARLRESLDAPGLVRTVIKRGYRLDVVDSA